MSAEAKTGADALKKTLLDIEKDIQSAWDYLGLAQETTYIEEAADQIRTERQSLNAFLNHLAKAQTVTDDALLAGAVAELKPQAATLRKVIEQIKQIDAAAAAEVVGYMETAVTLITQALGTMAALP